MTTFERLYIADEETHQEHKNPYYTHIDRVETAERILRRPGLENNAAPGALTVM